MGAKIVIAMIATQTATNEEVFGEKQIHVRLCKAKRRRLLVQRSSESVTAATRAHEGNVGLSCSLCRHLVPQALGETRAATSPRPSCIRFAHSARCTGIDQNEFLPRAPLARPPPRRS